GMGGRFKQGTPDEVATQEDINTYAGVTRIVEYAFELAKREVVMVDKSNAMTYAGGLWQERWKAIAKTHPNLKTRHLFVDAAAMQSSGKRIRQLGHREMADAIEGAVESAIRAGECTRDLGGSLSTSQAGDAVVKRLKD